MRDDDNLMSGNGASSSRSNSSVGQANGHLCIASDVKVGHNVQFSQFINLYGCEVGDETKIGAFVEIQKNSKVGRRCKVSSHTFICEGVTIEDEVLV
jgi:UDP-3-O-[3-hydroxymyristoyl] glucosamine N-acyltransferase